MHRKFLVINRNKTSQKRDHYTDNGFNILMPGVRKSSGDVLHLE